MSVIMFNYFLFISVSFLIGVLVLKFMVLLNMFMLLLVLFLPIVLILIGILNALVHIPPVICLKPGEHQFTG